MAKIRPKALFAVYKKEILDVLRDKRTLAIMILLPLVLYPVMMLVGSQVATMFVQGQMEKEYNVAFTFGIPGTIRHMLEEDYDKYKLNVEHQSLEELQEVAAYVTVDQQNGRNVYSIHYNSSQTDSSSAATRLQTLLTDYQRMLTRNMLQDAGMDPEITLEPFVHELTDTSAQQERTGMFLGSILPFFLIVGVVTGAIYPAIDVTSGEKERGTLETLLTLPMSNLELLGGKFMAVASVAVVSALLNFLSLALVGIFLFGGMGGEEVVLDWGALALPLLISIASILVFSLFVSAVILCVTSFAKSFKEANNYITPVLLVFMLPGFVGMVPDLSLTSATAAIPIVNIALLVKDVLMLNYNVVNMAVVLLSNIAYAWLAIVALAKIYNSEDILFGTGGLNLLEGRSSIIPGTKVSPSDGVVVFLIGLVATFYTSTLAGKWGVPGLAVTQAVLLAMPLLAAYYLRADFKSTFKLRLPRLSAVAGALLFWLGTFIIVFFVNILLVNLLPQGQEVTEQLADVLMGGSFWVTLLVVALLPAVCEELFFRGFVFSSLQGSLKPGAAILFTAGMFALMHFDIRILPVFILGTALTLAVAKTGSILIPMLMHFVNNGVAVVSLFYPQAVAKLESWVVISDILVVNVLAYLGLAALLLVAGYRLLQLRTLEDF